MSSPRRPWQRFLQILLVCIAGSLTSPRAWSHDEPTSFIDLRLGPDGIDASMVASTTDLAHDLPGVEPAMLLQPAMIASQRTALVAIVQSRLHIITAGATLAAEPREFLPIPENRDLRLDFHYAWPAEPAGIHVQCRLFPYDSRHRTFLNVYRGTRLERQEIFEGNALPVEFRLDSEQSSGAVFLQFLREGVHHIFIGPDHILFVIGLLLLGGSPGRLLKIITAFTVAHSITLGLATFRIVSPPVHIIEPLIASSIVFVGIHAFIGRKQSDPRLLLAFGFGLIHGFGFANVLQEMELPRHALGWALFAFNTGVEAGQVCIVFAVAPLLALLRRRHAFAAERVVATAALVVITAGAYWFFQRVIG